MMMRKSARQLSIVFAQLTPERKRQLLLVFVLMIAAAVGEVVAIGSVVPFLAALTFDSAAEPRSLFFLKLLAPYPPHRQLEVATVLLGIAAFAAGALRLALIRQTQLFVYLVGHDLLVSVHRRGLFQPYLWHLEHSSIEQLALIEKVELVTHSILLQIAQAVAATLFAAFVAVLLLALAPAAAVACATIVGIVYATVGLRSRLRLFNRAEAVNVAVEQRVRIVQESYGAIRDLILDQAQQAALAKFAIVDQRLARARADTAFMAALPRPITDAVAVTLIAAVAIVLQQRSGGLGGQIPVLGALALAAQRLIPLVQQLFVAWSNMAANSALLSDVSDRLLLAADPAPKRVPRLPFERRIEFSDVTFAYPSRTRPAVRNLTFTIPRGCRIAFAGETGSGKSTAADLLMGLLEPSSGLVCVDGTPLTSNNRAQWQANIAHVPQKVFLADASIAENVALSEQYDAKRVAGSLVEAQLYDFVQSLPEGSATRIGEGGARLSGGERQRLAIARAIYRRAPVLVLDEATNALDNRTELAVLQALDRLQARGCTIVLIAHTGAATATCDRVINLSEGEIVEFPSKAESS